jgi:hypothetical protein
MVARARDRGEHRAVRRGSIDQDIPVIAANKRRLERVLDLGKMAREQIGRSLALEPADERLGLAGCKAARRADDANPLLPGRRRRGLGSRQRCASHRRNHERNEGSSNRHILQIPDLARTCAEWSVAKQAAIPRAE